MNVHVVARLFFFVVASLTMATQWEDIGGQRGDDNLGVGSASKQSKEALLNRRGPDNPSAGCEANADYLRCMNYTQGSEHCQASEQFSLDAEVYKYVCAVMHPESLARWAHISMWQRTLQVRCRGYSFPCPFWYAVVYGLDIGLRLEAGRNVCARCPPLFFFCGSSRRLCACCWSTSR